MDSSAAAAAAAADGGVADASLAAPVLITHDAAADPGPTADIPGNVCAYSTFVRHFDRINAEDGVKMMTAQRQHNVCKTCKRLEFEIKGNMEAYKMETKHTDGLNDWGTSKHTARAEVLLGLHNRALWDYRWHNARDHTMRGTFNHMTRVADECNATPGLQDNQFGKPRSVAPITTAAEEVPTAQQ